jgi:lipopolysaccharide export system permease protein
MRIFTRYILSEFAKVFFLSLGGLSMMMIVEGVVQEGARQGLPMGQMMRLIPYIMPFSLCISLPVALLLTVSYVYGRMSGSNEVVAIKALGISPLAILWPVFAAAFLLSLVTVWLDDVAASWGRRGARRVVVEAVEEIAYGMLRTQRSYSTQSFAINVRRVEGDRLVLCTVTLHARGNSPEFTITADEAQLHADQAQGVLKIALHDATVDYGDKFTLVYPGIYEQEIPLDDATRDQDSSNNPSSLPLWRIPKQEAEQRDLLSHLKQEMASRAAYQMLCGDFDDLVSPEWALRNQTLALQQGRLCRLLTEPHRRWSAGFICLCFTWVGAPMAIRLRNRDFLTSFFLCFLPILIAFYPLLAYTLDAAKGGTLPAYAVWTGNVLLLVWGLYLIRKVLRY